MTLVRTPPASDMALLRAGYQIQPHVQTFVSHAPKKLINTFNVEFCHWFPPETISCSQMLLLPLLLRWFCNIFTVMYMYKPDRWLMQAF